MSIRGCWELGQAERAKHAAAKKSQAGRRTSERFEDIDEERDEASAHPITSTKNETALIEEATPPPRLATGFN